MKKGDEFLHRGEIVKYEFSDAEYDYYIDSRTRPGYAQKADKGKLDTPWTGTPLKIRKALCKAAGGFHEYWKPEGFFSIELDGQTYHCLKKYSVPVGGEKDLVAYSEKGRPVKNAKALDRLVDAAGLARGDIVILKLTASDGHTEMGSWRSTAEQFKASVEKYHLLAPGCTYEVVAEKKFRFEDEVL